MRLVFDAIRFAPAIVMSAVGLTVGLGADGVVVSALQVMAIVGMAVFVVSTFIPTEPNFIDRRPGFVENILGHAATLALLTITLTFPLVHVIIPILRDDIVVPSKLLLIATLTIWAYLAVSILETLRHERTKREDR